MILRRGQESGNRGVGKPNIQNPRSRKDARGAKGKRQAKSFLYAFLGGLGDLAVTNTAFFNRNYLSAVSFQGIYLFGDIRFFLCAWFIVVKVLLL